MLFSDKLEQIWQESLNDGIKEFAVRVQRAFEEEIKSGIGRGNQYDLKAHIVRIDNAWRLFVKDKPQFKPTFFESLVKAAAPDVAKKVWNKQ